MIKIEIKGDVLTVKLDDDQLKTIEAMFQRVTVDE